MKNAKFSDVFASVNYEFSRRCTLSEPIMARLADDLIARYSPKHQPHPDFFKEDAALALNQLTLYIDQFIQVMRNYQFLQKAATIISTLTTACLRINDFLAKQLYHYMKADRPGTAKRSATTQFLCPACGKLRENEKLRVMRDELHIPRSQWKAPKIVREIVGKNGDKYDVEELIQEEMQNLDSLNQEEMRKRLQGLEIDHDRRKQEMMVCLEQLKRANDRVTGYSKTIQKKGKDWEGRFNVKDYVFQLSRHFYHNLSNLDNKIKLLKLNMSPIDNQQTQTEQACVLLSEHNGILTLLNNQIAELKVSYNDTKTRLMLQQRKCKEDDQMVKFLQEKISKIDNEREEERLKWTLTEKHLNGQVAQDQNRITSLQNLIKKFRHITKVKNLGLIEDEDDQFYIKTESVGLQFPQVKREQRNSEFSNDFKEKYYSKAFKDNRLQWKESLLLNPNMVMMTDSLDLKNIALRDSQKSGKISTPLNKFKPGRMKEERQARFALVSVINESIIPDSKSMKLRIISCSDNYRNDFSIKDRIVDNEPEDQKHKRVRLNRLNSNKRNFDKKITTINSRKSVLILENERSSHCGEDQLQDEHLNLHTVDHKTRKNREKTTLYEYRNLKNQLGEESNNIKRQLGLQRKENDEFNVIYRPKKRRNFSQEHSLDDKGEFDLRRSADRNVWNEKKIFAELSNVLQIIKSPSQFQKKHMEKKSLPSRGDYTKTALSLQEINFSTYVYSLTAKLHLKNQNTYLNLKKYLCLVSGYNSEDQNSIKNALKIILISHRRCTGNGSVCKHLQNLLDKIKSM